MSSADSEDEDARGVAAVLGLRKVLSMAYAVTHLTHVPFLLDSELEICPMVNTVEPEHGPLQKFGKKMEGGENDALNELKLYRVNPAQQPVLVYSLMRSASSFYERSPLMHMALFSEHASDNSERMPYCIKCTMLRGECDCFPDNTLGNGNFFFALRSKTMNYSRLLPKWVTEPCAWSSSVTRAALFSDVGLFGVKDYIKPFYVCGIKCHNCNKFLYLDTMSPAGRGQLTTIKTGKTPISAHSCNGSYLRAYAYSVSLELLMDASAYQVKCQRTPYFVCSMPFCHGIIDLHSARHMHALDTFGHFMDAHVSQVGTNNLCCPLCGETAMVERMLPALGVPSTVTFCCKFEGVPAYSDFAEATSMFRQHGHTDYDAPLNYASIQVTAGVGRENIILKAPSSYGYFTNDNLALVKSYLELYCLCFSPIQSYSTLIPLFLSTTRVQHLSNMLQRRTNQAHGPFKLNSFSNQDNAILTCHHGHSNLFPTQYFNNELLFPVLHTWLEKRLDHLLLQQENGYLDNLKKQFAEYHWSAQLRIQYQQAYAGLFSSKYGGGYTTFIHHSDLRKVGVPLLSSSIHFPFPYFSSTFGVQRRVSVIPFNRVYYDVPRMDPFKMRPFVLMTAHKEPLEPVEESDDPTSRGPAPKKPMFRKNAGPA